MIIKVVILFVIIKLIIVKLTDRDSLINPYLSYGFDISNQTILPANSFRFPAV